jgi:hypothetical protein
MIYDLNGRPYEVDEGAERRYERTLRDIKRYAEIKYRTTNEYGYMVIIEMIDATLERPERSIEQKKDRTQNVGS